MPLFNVTVKKLFIQNQQSWGNRYIIRADDIDAANTSAAGIIVDHEVTMHSDQVQFVNLLVSSVTEFDTVFISTPLSGVGTQATDDPIVPIQTVVEAVIGFGSGSRPGRKFYHLCPDLGALTDVQHWALAIQSLVTSEVGGMIFDLNGAGTPWVSPTDAEAGGNITKPEYRYHQFTKASKRALETP